MSERQRERERERERERKKEREREREIALHGMCRQDNSCHWRPSILHIAEYILVWVCQYQYHLYDMPLFLTTEFDEEYYLPLPSNQSFVGKLPAGE